MYDLTEFSFKDMAKCGLTLRQLGQDTTSMEESSQKIVKYIYEYFCDGQTGEKSCALVRFFKTHPYGQLEPSLQELVRNSANGIAPTAEVKCWTLLATAGAEHYWNSRYSTSENVPIPLVSAEFVSQIPELSAMIERFGVGIPAVLEPDAEIRRELDKKTLDIFYVSEAEDNPLIPEQDSLIVPYEVRSVLGFGGMLPSGSLFAVQMFLKLEIPQTIAELFKTLALSVKTSLLPFDGGVVFESSATAEKIVPSNNIIIDAKLLNSQIATLSQLLDISDQATLKQATRLQRTIGNLKREIADRHQTEQALRDSQAKFSGILDIAEDAIICVDETQIIQLFNQGAEKIFGYSSEDVLGKSLELLLPMSARAHHQQHISNFGKSGTVARTMSERSGSGVLGRRKNGEEFPAEASISKLKSGESFIYTVILKDITDRKQTEEALQQKNQELAQIVQSVQESQAKFYGILDIADDAIISIDEQQIIQIFNQGAEKIFGYSAEEAIGQSLETLLPVGTRGHHQQHISNFGKSETVARTMSERSGSGVLGRRKNGEEFPAEASISKLKSGESFIYTVILKDITDRKLAEAALHQKHEQLVGTLQQLENAQAELIQSEKLAALGQLVAGVAHEVNTPLGAIRSSVEYISDFLKQNLEKLPDFFQEMSGDRKYYFQAILQRSLQNTISVSGRERRQLRKAIAAELAQQEVNNADTLANLLIDLGIHSNLEPFLPVLKAEDSESFLKSVRQFARLQESVRDINTASDRAAKVVFALKNYARRDYSGETIEANIIDGIETVLTLYHNQIKHGVDVTRNYQEIPAIRCYFDELNQVWTNLIHNGLQAMDNKGKLDVAVVRENGNVKVSITDSGKGIPEEIKEKIFMPFFTTKPPGEGSGLGLDIVKKIVQKHQGNIEVTSAPGQTTFTVILPIGGTQPATKS